MRKIISLFLLLPTLVCAAPLAINENSPESYVVIKGDTLWDIAAKFYKDPWKWPAIWGLNKDTIANPHWIYPGDLIYLDRSTGTLKVHAANADRADTTGKDNVQTAIEKLSPRIRVINNQNLAIPEIPLKDIAPFLTRPLLVEDSELASAPKLIGTYEKRKMLAANDVAYVEGMPDNKGTQWQVFRLGQTFIDPETKETLGHEVLYLGDADVEKFDQTSQLRITHARMEIVRGDRFAQTATGYSVNYSPHAPSEAINARIISIYGGMTQTGQNSIITLNKGKRDGLENGHVLALYQKGETLIHSGWFKPDVVAPDVRYGLIIIFRVFEKVSYALVLQTQLPIQLQDTARTP